MSAWICVTCGVQYPDTDEPPARCPICADERQYVGWDGQRWTTMAELAREHSVSLREEEAGLLGVGVEPAVAIGQRALLVRTPHGNVVWDCISLLDDNARQQIDDRRSPELRPPAATTCLPTNGSPGAPGHLPVRSYLAVPIVTSKVVPRLITA